VKLLALHQDVSLVLYPTPFRPGKLAELAAIQLPLSRPFGALLI